MLYYNIYYMITHVILYYAYAGTDAWSMLGDSSALRRNDVAHTSEKGEVLLRGVGTLQHIFPQSASVQWQPNGLTIHAKKWFLGAGFL